ncbi:MAG: glycosyltransferase [Candidatus Gracilibacteria bacterium]|nr:glycosyltransferase [Candidatus Gracilibacteria bacterium]
MSPKNNICLIHDMFLYRGGAERFNIMMARTLGADLAALFFSSEGLDPRSLGFTGKMIPFGENKYNGLLRQLYLKWRVLFHTGFLREYDTVIFSNDSLSAIHNARKGARKIYYAHSIPRYLFDQRAFYYQKVPVLLRPLYIVMRWFWEWMYRRELAQVDAIYVNSRNLQVAMRQYLGRESEIIHPPVDTDYFVPLPRDQSPERPVSDDEGYYLSFSKLSSLKRVNRVVEAFREMPDKKLLVIYGENDPQKDEIMLTAQGCNNITFLKLSDNNELPQYIARAIAVIFIAKNEDFGMVALESMSCGVPVIGVREGGIQETVVDGETGILISKGAPLDELKTAVESLDRARADSMRDACIAHAEQFSLKHFEKMVREKFL